MRNKNTVPYGDGIFSFLVVQRFRRNLAMGLFKGLDAPAHQIKDLRIDGSPFIFGDIAQLRVQPGIDFDAEMLVVFISHRITAKILI